MIRWRRAKKATECWLRNQIGRRRRRRLAKSRLPELVAKENAGYKYLVLTCRDDLLMARVSLTTLALRSRLLPRLTIAVDDSLDLRQARQAFAFWPSDVDFWTKDSVRNTEFLRQRPLLDAFCRRHVFGFKLACCHLAASEGTTLYGDGDVLWFADPIGLVKRYDQEAFYAAEDYYPSYDRRLLALLDSPDPLRSPPFVNAGLVLYNRLPAEIDGCQQLLERILETDPIGHYCEQTLTATMVRAWGATFPEQAVYSKAGRLTWGKPSFASQPWVARHYVTPIRGQFWIDAAAAIVGENPTLSLDFANSNGRIP